MPYPVANCTRGYIRRAEFRMERCFEICHLLRFCEHFPMEQILGLNAFITKLFFQILNGLDYSSIGVFTH